MPDRRAVVEPLRHHRQLALIGDGDEIAPGVSAVVTRGHSVGHNSYVVTSSAGQRLIAFRDIFHVPAQLSHPQWGSAPDAVPQPVPAARQKIINDLLHPATYGFALHFGDQPFGRVRLDANATPRWQPLPTVVLAPPPPRPATHEPFLQHEAFGLSC